MTATIFPQHSLSLRHADILVTLITALAVDDLTHSHALRWKESPPEQCSLCWRGRGAAIRTDRKMPLFIQAEQGPRTVEKAANQVEKILDRYHMDEEERDTLYTALACLGLHALQDYLEWEKEPPFEELGAVRE